MIDRRSSDRDGRAGHPCRSPLTNYWYVGSRAVVSSGLDKRQLQRDVEQRVRLLFGPD